MSEVYEYLTNTSVRERFGIEPQNIAYASRLIKEAVEAGVIAAFDPSAAPKLMKYVPWWAQHHPRPSQLVSDLFRLNALHLCAGNGT